MTDLKSWFSGENYYDLTPFFFQNRRHHDSESSSTDGTMASMLKQQADLLNSSRLHKLANLFNKNKINPNKNFLIHFRNMKWQLQIEDDESLKSITCILLDQSLDIGIDNNPLMLDLTITDHFQNRYKLFSTTSSQNNVRNSTVYYQFNHHQSQISNFYSKLRLNTVASVAMRASQNKSVFSSNSQKSKLEHSPSLVNIAASQPHPDVISENGVDPANTASAAATATATVDLSSSKKASKVMNASIALQAFNVNQNSQYDSTVALGCVNSTSNLNSSNNQVASLYLKSCAKPAKYEAEFQELQLILLWFPEEVAFRLTEVEYALFKQVHPSEYLRYASLNLNNAKSAMLAESAAAATVANVSSSNNKSELADQSDTKSIKLNNVSVKCVEDLLVRYKEVS